MDTSEVIALRKAKYDKIERATDTLGRLIGYKQLTPSRQLKVREMAPNLEGDENLVDPDSGKVYQVAKIMPLVLAASVVEIDSNPITFPRSRGELDAVLDMLDEEGMLAIVMDMAKRAEARMKETERAVGTDAAKN